MLGLCEEAGLVEVGVISIDGTKMRANASRGANRTYEKLVADILKEAEETDRWEDGLFGPIVAMRCRSICGPRRAVGRRSRRRGSASRRRPVAARSRRWRGSSLIRSSSGRRVVGVGARGTVRLTRSCCAGREQDARPIARGRAERLLEALHRLEEKQQVESGPARPTSGGRRSGARAAAGSAARDAAEAVHAVAGARGEMNKTDPDSRMMRTQGQPTVQGYNTQAAVTRDQIIVAADVAVESPDFGHLEPAVRAALRELEDAGVTPSARRSSADAGYWHTRQMENIVSDGIQVLVPPDAGLREGTRPGWDKGPYAFMRRVLASEAGHELYKHRKATVEPVFAQNKFNRGFRRFQRRGRAAARSEWRFQAATHNLLKLHTHWISPAIA